MASDQGSANAQTNNAPTPRRTHYGVPLLPLKIANVVAFILALIVNALSAGGGIGAVGRKYPTQIKPCCGALSIWLCIYGLQGIFLVYQFFWPEQDESTLLHGIGFWFLSSCLFNALWILTFVQATTVSLWCSAVCMFCLLFSVCKIYVNTDMWRKARPGGLLQGIALDVHISTYAGWVTVATIVSTATTLTTVLETDAFQASFCSAVMIVCALLLNILIVVKRQDCIWGWILVWSTYFISVAHSTDPIVYTAALVACVVMGIVQGFVSGFVLVKWLRRQQNMNAGYSLPVVFGSTVPLEMEAEEGENTVDTVVDAATKPMCE